MLHAPISETKTETTQSKLQLAPQPGRELHPHSLGAAGAYALNGAGSTAPVRPPGAQRYQIFAGMQATHGNQAVLRMMQSSPQVARMTALRPSQGVMLQRKCACGGTPESTGECAECKEKREAALQRRAMSQDVSPTTNTVPPIVPDVLRSPGQPLDAGTRAFMEPRFGYDFSQVRVHTDAKAAESAQAVNALAYTVGKDVVFGMGQYGPGTHEGRRLVAHELTHVVQQGKQNSLQGKLELGAVDDHLEREADHVAAAITATASALRQGTVGTNELNSLTPEEEPLAQNTKEELTASFGNKQMTITQHCPINFLESPILQRTAKFVAGTVNAKRNAADWINGARYVGATIPILNGTWLLIPDTPDAKDAADAKKAIHRPQLRKQSDPAGDVTCRINTVPTNVGSFNEDVLSNGPWTTLTTKENLATKLGLRDCAGPGRARYTEHGVPSDADVAAANRKHEDYHVADLESTFNDVVVPWDNAMSSAKTNKQTFRAADMKACEATLFAAVGGTPDDIATRLVSSVSSKSQAFHNSPAGSPLQQSNPRTGKNCDTAEADVSA